MLDESADGVQSIELAVVDTGVGLTDDQQRRLFDDFTQADPTTTQRYGGTGLGLVICRRLAVLMGGEVTMDSEVGKGTTMRLILSLPEGDPALVLSEASFTSTRSLPSRPTPSRDEAIRERSLVLVAADHSVNRAVLLHQLDAIGLCADAAVDGQEALELFTTGRYAMVLTDVHMPRLDGYELAEAIRRHEADLGWPRTPIMALTANVMHGEPQRCREAGMDDFASKPTTIPLLAAKVRELLPHLEFLPPAVDQVETDRGDERGDEVLDTTVLDELTGADAALAAAVLRDFVESTVVDMARLGEALEVHDLDEVRRQAHRIKGATAWSARAGSRPWPLESKPRRARGVGMAAACEPCATSWRPRSRTSLRRLLPSWPTTRARDLAREDHRVVSGYGGTYRATVVDDADPMQQYRLQVVVPEVYGDVSVWAAASLPVGSVGPMPAVGDLVWVSFEHGDTDYPVWERDPGADQTADATAGYIGKYRGVVVGNDDPMQQGRVEVTVPEIYPTSAWALPSADAEHGETPEVGVEVWIEYDNGDPAYPRWVVSPERGAQHDPVLRRGVIGRSKKGGGDVVEPRGDVLRKLLVRCHLPVYVVEPRPQGHP